MAEIFDFETQKKITSPEVERTEAGLTPEQQGQIAFAFQASLKAYAKEPIVDIELYRETRNRMVMALTDAEKLG